MQTRCQISKADSRDPTGEYAMECNAPAEYCAVCDMSVCPECHLEITGSHTPHEKKPPATATIRDSEKSIRRVK
ncbi:MAG TPA: hypothetical protein VG649_21775 [Candidatus Angelobacter sp.]|jgi:hypothetical protein|nr:hypothetical protein [Candidatus Angelobacter sp.]